jgi:ComF family protein
LQRINGNLCPGCGTPNNKEAVCSNCREHSLVLDGLRAYARYSGALRNAIHRLKYQRDIALAETLAGFLVELYYETRWQIDLVAPVPLGVVRRRERGYNQAAMIAYPFALAVRVSYSGGAIRRVRETVSQVDLKFSQRLENVQDAFWADPQKVAGKKVMVIDDVTTTGATLNACAEALKNAGAITVYGFVVARTFLSEGGKNDRAS